MREWVNARKSGVDQAPSADSKLVEQVKVYMKENKVSQVKLGEEARISQAVISQWLALKYYGHNDKVYLPPPPPPPPRLLWH